jgi:hypothetical protein
VLRKIIKLINLRKSMEGLMSINLLIFLLSMCTLLLSFTKTPGMHWLKVAFVFLFGGFFGIAIMAALSIARSEEEEMDESNLIVNNEIENNVRTGRVKKQ